MARSAHDAAGQRPLAGRVRAAEVGRYEYTVVGWVDAFETWHRDLRKRIEAGQDVAVDLQIGAQLVGQAAERANGDDADAAAALANAT